MLALALVASLAAGAGFPEQLTRPLPGSISKDKTWTWPQKEAFDEAWKLRMKEKTSFALLTGELDAGECKASSVVLRDHVDASGKRFLSAVMDDRNNWCAGYSWEVKKAEGETLTLENHTLKATFTVRSRQEPRGVPEAYLTDWTYAATLLAAQPAGAKLLEEYANNVPMGQCSMDTRPSEFAQEFAERCYKQGELACFLQLQIRVMGDQFASVATSSYGEEAHPTHAGRLESTGIDVDRFFRGLVLMLPGDRPSELGTWRLSRALIESGRREKFEPLLLAMLQDESLDPYNRFRAFTTWSGLYFRSKDRKGLEGQVAKLKLEPMSKKWWDQVK